MIVLAEGAGNHSNRLFQSIHFEAFCLEHKIKYRNIVCSDMVRHFPNIKREKFVVPNFLIIAVVKILIFLKISKIKYYTNESDIFKDAVDSKQKFLLVGGWEFRVSHLTKKYCEYFSNKYKVSLVNNTLMESLQLWKSSGRIVVGVHIRRGDYKYWENGKYYFSNEVYEFYINQFVILFEKEKKLIEFIIFSNEKVSLKSKNNLTMSSNEWYLDHAIMSQCDYLIGPPSTFTLWASYIGHVKYYHIQDKETYLSLENFIICQG